MDSSSLSSSILPPNSTSGYTGTIITTVTISHAPINSIRTIYLLATTTAESISSQETSNAVPPTTVANDTPDYSLRRALALGLIGLCIGIGIALSIYSRVRKHKKELVEKEGEKVGAENAVVECTLGEEARRVTTRLSSLQMIVC
jgi:hypothetical protein